MQTLKCKCGTYLYLSYEEYKAKIKDKTVIFYECPVLKCPICNEVYIPDASKPGINDALERALESKEEIVVYPRLEQEIYKEFISTAVHFVYDPYDYFLIPGLWRPWNTGFLTPVFFNIEVLLKYCHHPAYSIELGANTYGNIYHNSEHMISFGINRNSKVVIWLGDIADLSIEEQHYLRSENIESDHDVASEFYEGQIEVKWADPSNDNQLFKSRLTFHEIILERYRISVTQLEPEAVLAASKIIKPIVNTDNAFRDAIIPLNMVFVESINNKELKNDIISIDKNCDLSNLRGLKLLQLWLEKRLQLENAADIVCPLFVLYDLRIAFAHLQSKEKSEELIAYSCRRLGLSENCRDFIVIYDSLISSLNNMYDRLIQSL